MYKIQSIKIQKSSIIYKYIMIYIVILVFGQNALAAPAISNVSGTFTHGNSITISGSGFGEKSIADPLEWENFENGIDEGLIGNGWSGSFQNYQHPPRYSSSYNRPGSRLNYHSQLGPYSSAQGADDTFYSNSYIYKDFGDLSKVYISFWMRFSWGNFSAPVQIKTWRLVDEYFGTIHTGINNFNWNPSNHYVRVDRNDEMTFEPGFSRAYPLEQWFFVELIGKESGDGIPDGSWLMNMSYPNYSQPIDSIQSLPNIITRKGDYHWRKFFLGQYVGNTSCRDTCRADLYYDDIYLDNTWARVVICDSALYSSCTHRAMQIPVTWVDGSITVKINQDEWSSGSTAYLYVVDENGEVSATGYPIAFSSNGDDVNLPSMPSGLSVL